MKNIKVEIRHCPPEFLLKEALEIPYSTEMNEKNWRKIGKRVIEKMKHESIAEHLNITFKLDRFSRLNLMEGTRHRITSPTVKSTRFTLDKMIDSAKNSEDVMVTPYKALKDEDIDLWLLHQQEFYNYIVDKIKFWKAKGYKNDVLKYWLSEATRTEELLTINIRSLFNWFNLRLGNKDNKPHFEIQYLSQLMLIEVLKTDVHWLFKRFEGRL